MSICHGIMQRSPIIRTIYNYKIFPSYFKILVWNGVGHSSLKNKDSQPLLSWSVKVVPAGSPQKDPIKKRAPNFFCDKTTSKMSLIVGCSEIFDWKL